jgi:hypothetical protein
MINVHLFGLLFACASSFSAELLFSQATERSDNFEILQTLCDKIAKRITEECAPAGDIPIFLTPIEDQASMAALLRGRIVARSLEKGRIVYSHDSSSNAANYLQIESPVLKYGVEYSPVRAGWLFRKSTARRYAAIEVDVELIEKPAGRVWLHDLFKAEFADTIRASEINELENPRLPFTIGNQRQKSTWSQMMEPLLLVVGTGVAIYALYALRSQ